MRISAPSGYRRGDNDTWDHCVLCGDRLWPGAMLAEYDGKQYCSLHLQAKLENEIDATSWNLGEEHSDE